MWRESATHSSQADFQDKILVILLFNPETPLSRTSILLQDIQEDGASQHKDALIHVLLKAKSIFLFQWNAWELY